MPLPKPQKGQSETDFVSRCLSSDVMKSEFPDKERRIAVCYNLYKQSKKDKKTKGSFEEPRWGEIETDRCLFL